jgi:hypothetical protein
MNDLPISDIQIVQEDETNCRVLVVPRQTWNEEHAAWFKARLDERFRNLLNVHIETVSEIPLAASGKRLLAINRLETGAH